MADLIEELSRASYVMFKDGWQSKDLAARAGIEILRLREENAKLKASPDANHRSANDVATVAPGQDALIADIARLAVDAMSAPPANPRVITMPTTADEAEAMEKLGFAWLKEHAPERLTAEGLARPIPDANPQLRGKVK